MFVRFFSFQSSSQAIRLWWSSLWAETWEFEFRLLEYMIGQTWTFDFFLWKLTPWFFWFLCFVARVGFNDRLWRFPILCYIEDKTFYHLESIWKCSGNDKRAVKREWGRRKVGKELEEKMMIWTESCENEFSLHRFGREQARKASW